jgi:hypothetical protein
MIKIPNRALDWQKLCIDLREYDSIANIARKLGVIPNTLRKLSQGNVKNPRWDIGIELIHLHNRHCNNSKVYLGD